MMRLLAMLLVSALLLPAGAFAEATAGYANARPTDKPTALDRYIAKPDASYKWELARTEKEDGLTTYTLDLVSQEWLTKKEVDRTIWRHWLTISVPDEMLHPTALLYIEGGSTDDGGDPPTANGDFKDIARVTQTITATIYNVPNQPLVFSDMKGWPRIEDSIIAYTWDKFVRTGNEEWPLRLPMTKSAVRAMDAVQEFCASDTAGKRVVTDFVVVGGSKRGWTAWMTAIADKRVRAVVPAAIDVVNAKASLRHQWESLGRWSAAMGDYLALGYDQWMDTPENEALMAIIDPGNYLDRLTMPKLLMMGANDQFAMPDSAQFYWDTLPGPKWLRHVPNAGHPIDDSAVPSVAAFYAAIASDTPLPAYSFAYEDNGAIVVRLEPSSDGKIQQPESVVLWQGYNPEKRDARGANVVYQPSDLAPESPGVYRATVQEQSPGYTFYLVELTYPGATPETPFRFTSGCRVAPLETPFKYTPPAEPPKGFLTAK